MLASELILAALQAGRPDSAVGPCLQALRPGLPDAADDAAELGRVLAQAWNEFHIGPVVRLMELLKAQGVSEETLGEVRKALKTQFQQAQRWSKTLAGVRLERLARDLRSAVRKHEWNQAVALCEAILEAQSSREDSGCGYLGSILGSVENDPAAGREVAKLLARQRPDLIPEGMAALDAGMKTRIDAVSKGGAEFREREFVANLTQATVDLKNRLPARLDAKEDAKGKVDGFAEDVRGMIAVGFRFAELNYWPDIARLLIEFLPREQTETGKAAGVEARLYATLATEARRGVATTFRDLGEQQPVVAQFMNLAREAAKNQDERYLATLVELLGGLRATSAAAFTIDVMRRAKEPRLQEAALGALGNIGSPEALEALLEVMREALKARPLDAKRRRVVGDTLESLGKITRNPKTPEVLRDKLLAHVCEMLPPDEKMLGATACLELLAPKSLPQLAPAIRKWAAEVLTESLWTPVQQLPGQGAPEGRATILGPRQKVADLLQALASSELAHILPPAERRAMRFSGAQMALGEIFAKLKAPQALPLLELMIRSVGTIRPEAIGEYAQEVCWDVENERFTQLTPDRVMESLAFAITEMGAAELAAGGNGTGPAAQAARRVFEATRDGEFPAMPASARGKLFDFYNSLPAALKAAPPQRSTQQGMLAPGEVAPSVEEDGAAVPKLSAPDRDALLALLRKGGFFGGPKREQKIGAIVQLAAAGSLDAIPDFLKLLTDKDSMLAAAAGTALLDLTKAPHPARVTDLALEEMIDALIAAKLDTQKALRGLMRQINFERPACRNALKRVFEARKSPGLLYELQQVLGTSSPEDTLRRILGLQANSASPDSSKDAPRAEGAENTGIAATPVAKGIAGGELDRKRAYMEARRQWVAGGKKGPEPPMPT